MTSTTDPEEIKASRKKHLCSWCDTRIEQGQPYTRYRYFDGGDAGTVKLHPECFHAMQALPRDAMEYGFHPGDHPRGCNCFHDCTEDTECMAAMGHIESIEQRQVAV